MKKTDALVKPARELLAALGEILRASLKSALYRTVRFESKKDRDERRRAMQALLDEEHSRRLGWTSEICTYC